MRVARKKLTGAVLLMGPPADTAWIRYATGFEAPDPVAALCREAGVDLLVSPLEAGRAGGCCARRSDVSVHTAESLALTAADRRRPFAAVQALLRVRRVRSVRVGPFFPVHAARCLEAAGIAVRVETGALLPGRPVKSAQEIAHIRTAQRAAVKAAQAAMGMIRNARIGRGGLLRNGSGALTSEAVRARIEQVLGEAGCRSDGVIVAGGRQAADPHERGHGPLRAREAIVLDIFPRHAQSGYWGDLTRTVVRGSVGDVLLGMYAAVEEAQAAALARVTAGAPVRLVHAAARAVFERRGYVTTLASAAPEGFIHGTGHGVGLEIHEAPSLRDMPGRLSAGNVVTVEPGLYYRAAGGIRIEDTVEVTDRGAKILSPLPRTFRLDA